MDDLRLADLTIHVNRVESHVTLTWSGTSDARDPGVHLIPYLDGLVAHLRGSSVELDFTAMDYMNSATIAPIVRFIRDLDGQCPKVTVIYDPTRTFQKTTFAAIKALSILLRNLEVKTRSK